MHFVLGCRIDICRAIAEREWGWTPTIRIISAMSRETGALNDEDEFVRFISSTEHLRGIPPSSKVYLGYEWIFAWGSPAKEILHSHIQRGGKVLKFNNGKFEEVTTL